MNHPIVGARLEIGAGVSVVVRAAQHDGLIAVDDGGRRWRVQWCGVEHGWCGVPIG